MGDSARHSVTIVVTAKLDGVPAVLPEERASELCGGLRGPPGERGVAVGIRGAFPVQAGLCTQKGWALLLSPATGL